jgi:general secretion pathway protein D
MNKYFHLIIFLLCFAALQSALPLEAKDKEDVTFNFVDVELGAITKFVSEITGKNFIFDERVKGKISIIAPTPLNSNDAFNLFTAVLKLKGLTLVPSGVNAYTIVPSAEAKQAGVEVDIAKRPLVNETFVARLIPLDNISSDQALRFLQPVISRTGHISSFGPGNLLLVVDSGLNMGKILNILKGIDQPPLSQEPEVVFLKHASAETVARVLNDGLKKRGKKAPQAEGSAVADKRLNAVVLIGPNSMKEAMKRLISQLDVPALEAQGAINVYFLENADAEELAKVLQGLMKRDPKKGKNVSSPFESALGISITPDKATNSIVVVASPSDYASLANVISQLDRRRRQVYVEAMIVDAYIGKLRDIGSRWRVTGTSNGDPVVIGGVGSIDTSSMQSIISGLTGLTVGGMGNFMDVKVTNPEGESMGLSIPGFAALFSMSEFQGAVKVLSSPQILTSDNNEAEIIVGENVPFISKRERDATSTNTVLSSIERMNVGITLKITPQITEGDSVRLDIFQEISSVKESTENIITSVGPTTTTRSTKTAVVVRDNQTVVIGGLIQEKKENSEIRVPLLHRIPLLGWLFKYKTTSNSKINLLVFLTPHIIKDAEGIDKITGIKRKEYAKEEKIYAEGELIVKFKSDVTEDVALSLITGQEASVIKFFEDLGAYHIKLEKGQDVNDALEEFQSMPEVEYAEPNFIMSIRGETPGIGSPSAPGIKQK